MWLMIANNFVDKQIILLIANNFVDKQLVYHYNIQGRYIPSNEHQVLLFWLTIV